MSDTSRLLSFVRTISYEMSAKAVLTDADEQALEHDLIANPEAGALVQGAGGVRKVRIGRAGRGKRGGARVIYYYASARGLIFLLYTYAKGQSDDLTSAGKQEMKRLVADL